MAGVTVAVDAIKLPNNMDLPTVDSGYHHGLCSFAVEHGHPEMVRLSNAVFSCDNVSLGSEVLQQTHYGDTHRAMYAFASLCACVRVCVCVCGQMRTAAFKCKCMRRIQCKCKCTEFESNANTNAHLDKMPSI